MKNQNQRSALQAKLLASGVSLMIAAVMMTTSTYAWFTVSKTPELKKVEVNVQAEKNFEIALCTDKNTPPSEVTENDSDNQSSWGNSVTFESASTSGISIDLPVKATGKEIQVLQYSDTGRTNGQFASATAPSGTMENGIGYYTYKFADSNTEYKCAAVMGIWLRTNTSGTIKAAMSGLSGGGNLASSVKVGIRMGENDIVFLSDNGEAEVGSLEASKDGTYTELLVFIDGTNVTAMDMAGSGDTSVSKITIESIKFTNSSVGDGTT